MQITGYVGQTATAADGSQPIARMGRQNDIIVSELHGRYYEQAFRRNLFYAYTTAATLTASNTTYTGHGLYNGSSGSSAVNLVLQKVGVGVSVTSASMTGIALGYSSGQNIVPTGQTAATQVGNLYLGGAAPLATAFKAATLVTAGTPLFPIMHNTAAINTVGVDQVVMDFEGSVIVPPGGVITLLALGAASASSAVTAAFFWEEVPV